MVKQIQALPLRRQGITHDANSTPAMCMSSTPCDLLLHRRLRQHSRPVRPRRRSGGAPHADGSRPGQRDPQGRRTHVCRFRQGCLCPSETDRRLTRRRPDSRNPPGRKTVRTPGPRPRTAGHDPLPPHDAETETGHAHLRRRGPAGQTQHGFPRNPHAAPHR